MPRPVSISVVFWVLTIHGSTRVDGGTTLEGGQEIEATYDVTELHLNVFKASQVFPKGGAYTEPLTIPPPLRPLVTMRLHQIINETCDCLELYLLADGHTKVTELLYFNAYVAYIRTTDSMTCEAFGYDGYQVI